MPTEATHLERQFITPLGIISCGVKFDVLDSGAIETRKLSNGQSEVFKTAGHRVEMVSFKIKQPLYNNRIVADSCGWVFRVEKTNDLPEILETYCLIPGESPEYSFDIATGEHLDAIQVDYKDWTLHIGTEDGDVLKSRAEHDDWFPIRLANRISFNQSITEMKKNGFITRIPELKAAEKIYLQYLTAYDRKNEESVDTWLAVDERKQKLEDWIGLT